MEEAASGYAWEGALERSWENIQEDDDGNLQIDNLVQEQRKRQ